MDATAIVAALIGATGVVLAAWITARSRQKPPSVPSPPQVAYFVPYFPGISADDDDDDDDDTESEKRPRVFKLFRGFVWTVVFIFYFISISSITEIVLTRMLNPPEWKIMTLIFVASASTSFSIGLLISTLAKRYGL